MDVEDHTWQPCWIDWPEEIWFAE